ncbi:MAG: isochorismate synthase [Candidatus Hydrogenedentes bacterium]|nr:isochorismate synthase [Candidatus Hydrogenedentota bacterium]
MSKFEHLSSSDDLESALEPQFNGIPRVAADTCRGRIERIEFPVPAVEPALIFPQESVFPRIYWRNKDGSVEITALGAADRIRCFNWADYGFLTARLGERITSGEGNPRYYGGMRFDAGRKIADEWSDLGLCDFVLPRVEVIRRGERTRLAYNRSLDESQAFDRTALLVELVRRGLAPLTQILGRVGSPRYFPALHSRDDIPDRQGWSESVRQALTLFESGTLEKIVLARRTQVTFEAALDPILLLKNVTSNMPNSYCFLFQPTPDVAFLGASPECLYRRTGRTLETEAIAGTRPNGETYAQELLNSDKDRREHRIVVEALGESLSTLCGDVEADAEPSLLTLPGCQHLYTAVRGALREQVSDVEILRALHPTPAVGGSPTEEALRRIAELEPFDRGWYAGPIGWIGADEAEFAVGIRSGLVQGKSLFLYAGAGLVAGSTPEGEWEEVEGKMNLFWNALTAHDR